MQDARFHGNSALFYFGAEEVVLIGWHILALRRNTLKHGSSMQSKKRDREGEQSSQSSKRQSYGPGGAAPTVTPIKAWADYSPDPSPSKVQTSHSSPHGQVNSLICAAAYPCSSNNAKLDLDKAFSMMSFYSRFNLSNYKVDRLHVCDAGG